MIEDVHTTKLRAWYLARLRKLALQQENVRTPSALLEADRQTLGKLSASFDDSATRPALISKRTHTIEVAAAIAGIPVAILLGWACLQLAGGAL